MAYTIDQPYKGQEEIKKSRFLVHAFPLAKEEDFAPLLAEIKAKIPATHHCFAWKFGTNSRFFDDGEPAGTAGRPILSAIEGRNCDRLAIITVRWYGGIKLGTGGLARAYGGSAARLLNQVKLVEIVAMSEHRLHVPFALWPRLERLLGEFSARIEAQEFDVNGVILTLSLPQKKVENLATLLRDMSHGQIIL